MILAATVTKRQYLIVDKIQKQKREIIAVDRNIQGVNGGLVFARLRGFN